MILSDEASKVVWPIYGETEKYCNILNDEFVFFTFQSFKFMKLRVKSKLVKEGFEFDDYWTLNKKSSICSAANGSSSAIRTLNRKDHTTMAMTRRHKLKLQISCIHLIPI